jgi:hypothetical protein
MTDQFTRNILVKSEGIKTQIIIKINTQNKQLSYKYRWKYTVHLIIILVIYETWLKYPLFGLLVNIK